MLTLVILEIFPWIYSHIEAGQHLKRIIANGSKQGGMRKFHRQALVWRVVWIFGFGLLMGGLHRLITEQFPWVLLLAWLPYAFVAFGFNFTLTLNRKRNEVFPDYGISPWYVSRQINAAFSDRMLVRATWEWNRLIVEIRQRFRWNVSRLALTPELLAERVYKVSLLLAFLLLAALVYFQAGK